MLDLLPKLYEQLNKDREDLENKDNKISHILERMQYIILFICTKYIN